MDPIKVHLSFSHTHCYWYVSGMLCCVILKTVSEVALLLMMICMYVKSSHVI